MRNPQTMMIEVAVSHQSSVVTYFQHG